MQNPDLLALLTATTTGLAAFLGTALLLALAARRPDARGPSSFDEERRARLRQGDSFYRLCEGLIDRLARRNATSIPPERLRHLEREMKAASLRLPWLPEEYLAVMQVLAALVGVAGFLVGVIVTGSLLGGPILAALAAWGAFRLFSGDVGRRAAARRQLLLERLPFAIDLMSLMMQAGATFPECLAAVVNENPGHPIADEFGEVLRETNLGRTRRESLLALQQRIPDEKMSEFIFAMVKGEELGTPLSQILQTQADQMRLKRSQVAEKEAGEAQVAIVFPGMVIMLACLLIMVAPFLLQMFYSGPGVGGLFR